MMKAPDPTRPGPSRSLPLAAFLLLWPAACDYEGIKAEEFSSEYDIGQLADDLGGGDEDGSDASSGDSLSVDAGTADSQTDAAADGASPDSSGCQTELNCDDGDACTIDTCSNGVCGHKAADCDDALACTIDSCDKTQGCQHQEDDKLCDDGVDCTANDCIPLSGCAYTADSAECDDGLACTTDTCDSKLGCQHVAGHKFCADDKDCTVDTCDLAKGCTVVLDHLACDDKVPCTSDACTVKAGCVNNAVHAACDDGHDCTADSCDAAKGCQQLANNDKCNDGHACTADGCDVDKGCVHNPDKGECKDAWPCTVDDCDPAKGCVHKADNKTCDDGNVCTQNSCLIDAGCKKTLLSAGGCDDGKVCTKGEACDGGVCKGGKLNDCNDANDCTADSCDDKTGACVNAKTDGGGCSDGDLCSLNDLCTKGSCKGQPKACDDGDKCTTDSCNDKTGFCATAPVAGCSHCPYDDALTWHYGDSKAIYPSSAEQLDGIANVGQSGGSIAVGVVVAGDQKPDADCLVIRRDGAGKLLWTQIHGGVHDDGFGAVAARGDGQFWAAGVWGMAVGSQAWLLNMAADGTSKSELKFGDKGSNYLAAAVATSADGVIAVGHGDANGAKNALIVWADKDGKPAGPGGAPSILVGGTGSQRFAGLTVDGGKGNLYAVGSDEPGGGKPVLALVARVDKDGKPSSLSFGTYDDQHLSGVLQVGGGDLIAAGQVQTKGKEGQQAWLVRLDPATLQVKAQAFYGGMGADAFHAILPTQDGNVAAFGLTFEAGQSDGLGVVFGLDALAMVSKKLFGGGGLDELMAASHDGDGGLLLAGSSASFGKAGNADAWQLALSSKGTGCCKAKVDCDDGDPCSLDYCDAKGACAHGIVTDGVSCDVGKVCGKGKCEAIKKDSPPTWVAGVATPKLLKAGEALSVTVEVVDPDTDHSLNVDDIAHVVIDGTDVNQAIGKVTLLPKGQGSDIHASRFVTSKPLSTAGLTPGVYPLQLIATDKGGNVKDGLLLFYVYAGKILEVAKAGKPYGAIGPAIAAAAKGDAVRVGAGTWTGANNLNLGGQGGDVILISESGADKTIIDCAGAASAFKYFGTGHTFANVIAGFSIKNCTGSAIRVAEDKGAGAAIAVAECRLEGNSSPNTGGAVEAYGALAQVRMAQSVLINNSVPTQAGQGGAIAVANGAALDVYYCHFSGNKAAFGGAVAVVGGGNVSDIGVGGCHFKDNFAELGGGALSSGQAAKWRVISTLFEGNMSKEVGGAISSGKGGTWDLTHSTFVGNKAATYGGAISTSQDEWQLQSNTLLNNQAGVDGGAIFAKDGKWTLSDTIGTGNKATGSGGFMVHATGSATLARAYLANNEAGASGGALYMGAALNAKHVVIAGCKAKYAGGMLLQQNVSHVLHNMLFEGNSAVTGGGLQIAAPLANVAITSSTFVANVADYGAAIALTKGRLKLEDSILWNNTANKQGGQLYIVGGDDTGPVTISMCDISTQQGDFHDPDADINNKQGFMGVNGNFSADPQFTAGAQGNAYLSQIAAGQGVDSPCVDPKDQQTSAQAAGLEQMTTRTDGKPDTGKLDLGYHSPK